MSDYEKHTVAELRKLCSERGLALKSRAKQPFINCLVAYDKGRKRQHDNDEEEERKKQKKKKTSVLSQKYFRNAANTMPSLISKETKYLFWKLDSASYTKDQLREYISKAMGRAEGMHLYNIKTPRGMNFSYYYGVDQASDITARTIPDVSRSNGERTCPISHDLYRQPHIMNLTGRSYSLAAITEAIASTLQKGRPLVFDDGSEIHPSLLARLRLYPNYSLPGWDRKARIVHDGVVNSFNLMEAKRNNIPEFSSWLETVDDDYESWWTYIMTIYAKYRARRSKNVYASRRLLFHDLLVENVVLPRHSVKHPPTLFSNVQFKGCVILFSDSLGFEGCSFVRCRFITFYRDDRDANMQACELKDCQVLMAGSIRAGFIKPELMSWINGADVDFCYIPYEQFDRLGIRDGTSSAEINRRLDVLCGRAKSKGADDCVQHCVLVDKNWVPAPGK